MTSFRHCNITDKEFLGYSRKKRKQIIDDLLSEFADILVDIYLSEIQEDNKSLLLSDSSL